MKVPYSKKFPFEEVTIADSKLLIVILELK